MRFLVDESLSHRVASALTRAGHQALHVGDVGLLGAHDEAVLALAAEQARILLTADTDFGALLALSGITAPRVVLLRRGDRRAQQRAQAVLDASKAAGDALEEGALVVVEGTRLRVRRPLIV